LQAACKITICHHRHYIRTHATLSYSFVFHPIIFPIGASCSLSTGVAMSDFIDVASVARGNASARKPPANLPASFANISVNDVAQNITVFE
jgi:hypothetical protein